MGVAMVYLPNCCTSLPCIGKFLKEHTVQSTLTIAEPIQRGCIDFMLSAPKRSATIAGKRCLAQLLTAKKQIRKCPATCPLASLPLLYQFNGLSGCTPTSVEVLQTQIEPTNSAKVGGYPICAVACAQKVPVPRVVSNMSFTVLAFHDCSKAFMTHRLLWGN